MAATPDGKGYWLVASDGGIFTYGDAGFYGSAASIPGQDIVGMAVTPDGLGYWEVSTTGRVFPYGDAVFAGDTRSLHLNGSIVGITPDPVTGGYWLVGSDGGIFAFGAPFFGSTGSIHLNQPVVAMQSTGRRPGLLVRRVRRRHLRLRRRAVPRLHGRAAPQPAHGGHGRLLTSFRPGPEVPESPHRWPKVAPHVPTT